MVPVLVPMSCFQRMLASLRLSLAGFYVKHPPTQPRSANMVVCARKSTCASGTHAGCRKKCGSFSLVSSSSEHAAAKSLGQFIFISIYSASDKLGHMKHAECGMCPAQPWARITSTH